MAGVLNLHANGNRNPMVQTIANFIALLAFSFRGNCM